MNDNNSLAHTSWNCKYHIVLAPKYHTAGKNAKRIEEYIKNQLHEDRVNDQMTIKGWEDPFTGSK